MAEDEEMSELIFKPEDFRDVISPLNAAFVVETCQKLFDEWLEQQPAVIGFYPADGMIFPKMTYLSESYKDIDGIKIVRKARLVCIEEIKPCTHPAEKVKVYSSKAQALFDPGPVLKYGLDQYWQCECGVEVVPNSYRAKEK